MREIQFRAKSTYNGKWLYGYVCVTLGGQSVVVDNEGTILSVDENTIGEFTGCHDKNGTPIYEGDIVRKRVYDGMGNRPVRFENGAFICGYGWGSSTSKHPYLLDDSRIEVIGNIYDNPELIDK